MARSNKLLEEMIKEKDIAIESLEVELKELKENVDVKENDVKENDGLVEISELKTKDEIYLSPNEEIKTIIKAIIPCGQDRAYPFTRYRINLLGSNLVFPESVIKTMFKIKEVIEKGE